MEAAGLGRAVFVAHIDLTGRVFTNDDYRESRLDTVLFEQCSRCARGGLCELRRFRLAIDSLCLRHCLLFLGYSSVIVQDSARPVSRRRSHGNAVRESFLR